MLAKTWKKIGIIILIIACLWNIIAKLVKQVSFNTAIESAKSYIYSLKDEEEKQK